jgi:hypothetical protein
MKIIVEEYDVFLDMGKHSYAIHRRSYALIFLLLECDTDGNYYYYYYYFKAW